MKPWNLWYEALYNITIEILTAISLIAKYTVLERLPVQRTEKYNTFIGSL